MKIHSGPVQYSSDIPYKNLEIVGIISEGRSFRIIKARSGSKFVTLKVSVSPDAMYTAILRREYELCSTLSHPCIVSTLGFEENSPAGPAIVMEFIDGLSLDEFISHGASASRRMSVMNDILDGVNYLHHRGILHNDIKPDNVIVNSNGAARLIDFGLSSSDDSIYKGCIGGSDGYTAPEILRGEGPAGAASDIYSLGLVLKSLFGRRYALIADRCLNPLPAKRYQSVVDLKRALSFSRRLPYCVATVILIVASAVVVMMTLGKEEIQQPTLNDIEDCCEEVLEIREETREQTTRNLELDYEEMLAPRFNDILQRIRQEKSQGGAYELENEYFEYYCHLLDSLQKIYPMSAAGENAPEIVAFCNVGSKQQDMMEKIILGK